MHKPINKLVLALLALTSGLLLVASPALSGWLDQGQKLLTDLTGNKSTASALTESEVGDGLKEALKVGSGRVVDQLSTLDGFNTDPDIHIPLPDNLETVRSGLATIGMAGMMDDLELKLNRAAEVATPKAKALFLQAIQEMTMDDVMNIYNGPEDAATRYFQGKMSGELEQEMRPVVDTSLAEVGAIQSYESIMGEYKTLPFVPDVRADLTGYVVDKGLDGIFYYLAQEEAAIRADPAKRTTELLQKVFGAK